MLGASSVVKRMTSRGCGSPGRCAAVKGVRTVIATVRRSGLSCTSAMSLSGWKRSVVPSSTARPSPRTTVRRRTPVVPEIMYTVAPVSGHHVDCAMSR